MHTGGRLQPRRAGRFRRVRPRHRYPWFAEADGGFFSRARGRQDRRVRRALEPMAQPVLYEVAVKKLGIFMSF